jgi:hypothetical protein
MDCACDRDVLGTRLTSMTMFFSSSVGVNSCPSLVNSRADEQQRRHPDDGQRRGDRPRQQRCIGRFEPE